MHDDLHAETVRFAGHGGDELEGYLAVPLGEGPVAAVVVIHHMPGYDRSSKEIARRFAASGYAALLPQPLQPRRVRRQPRRRGGLGPGQGGDPRRPTGGRRRRGGRPPAGAGGRQRQGGLHRLLLGRAPVVPGRLLLAPRRRRRLLRRLRGRALRPRACRSRSGRWSTWPATCAARCSGSSAPRTSTPPRPRTAELERALTEAGKEFEFHTYQGRRPRLLLRRPPGLPPRGGHRRVGAHPGLLRPPPGGVS